MSKYFFYKILEPRFVRIWIIFINLINFKREKIFIHGIQRSGTNFLSYILTLNHIYVVNKNYFSKKYKKRNKPGFVHYYHKNTFFTKRYNGKKINFVTIDDYTKYLGEAAVKHIVIEREKKSWLKSIKSYAKLHKDWNYKDEDKFYLKEYKKFYDFYKKNSNNKNILFVKIDNLTKNMKDYSKIEKFLNKKLFFKKTNLYVSLRL